MEDSNTIKPHLPNPSLDYIVSTNWKIPNEYLDFEDLSQLGERIYRLSFELVESDPLLASSIRSIAHGCYLMLQSDDTNSPLKQIWSNRDGSGSISLTALNDEDLKIIGWAANNLTDNRILSRFNDILWLRNKDFEAAIKAADAYFYQVLDCLIKQPDQLYSVLNELKRVLTISAQTAKREQFKAKIIEIRDIGLRVTDKCTPWQIAELFSEVIKWSPDIFDESIVEALKKIANESHQKRDFEAERAVYDDLVSIFRSIKKSASGRIYSEAKAQSFAFQARFFREQGMNALGLTSQFEAAIEEYRKLGMRQLAKELYLELLEIQPKVQDEMKEFSHPMDLSNPAKKLIEYLDTKSSTQQIMVLARYGRIVSKAEFYEQGKKLSEQSLASMFSSVKINHKGRIIQRSEGVTPGELRTEAQHFEAACFPFTFHVKAQSALIDIGRYHLYSKNCISESDFDFVLQSPLISDDRKAAFKKGFIAGFRGDWLTAMSILMPQLENGLRELCEQAGIVMTNLKNEMVQTEQSMTDFLYNNQEAIKFLGEDLVFNLKALFADESGYNFRNIVAHGLVDDDDFESEISIYAWSFIMGLAVDLRKLLYDNIYNADKQ